MKGRQLELGFKPALPPFVWEFFGKYYKGSSYWDLDLIEYKLCKDGKIRLAWWVNDRLPHPFWDKMKSRTNKSGEGGK